MTFINVEELASKELVEGFTARMVHTGTMTFVYLSVKAGSAMPMHNHVNEQVANVLEGTFELTVDGDTQLLSPGKVAVIKPFQMHGGRAITDCLLMDVFLPEREDYKF